MYSFSSITYVHSTPPQAAPHLAQHKWEVIKIARRVVRGVKVPKLSLDNVAGKNSLSIFTTWKAKHHGQGKREKEQVNCTSPVAGT